MLLAAPGAAALAAARGGTLAGTPLHFAAEHGRLGAVRALLGVDPSAGAVRDAVGRLPLDLALWKAHREVAWELLLRGDLPRHAAPLLRSLGAWGRLAWPLYPLLVSRVALTPEQWAAAVPGGLPGMGHALPAVLARSPAEARCLLRRLAPAQQVRVWVGALALARAQRQAGVDCRLRWPLGCWSALWRMTTCEFLPPPPLPFPVHFYTKHVLFVHTCSMSGRL